MDNDAHKSTTVRGNHKSFNSGLHLTIELSCGERRGGRLRDIAAVDYEVGRGALAVVGQARERRPTAVVGGRGHGIKAVVRGRGLWYVGEGCGTRKRAALRGRGLWYVGGGYST